MRRVLSILIAGCVVLVAMPVVGLSQSTGAAPSGVVRNQTGESVQGATVTGSRTVGFEDRLLIDEI